MKKHILEDKALKLSITFLILFALVGILFGILLSSDVIFFDGIFSLFSVVTSLATLKISHFIRKKDHRNFPFGKESIEPVVVVLQYLILGGFLAYTLYDAIQTIRQGGNEVQLGGVILYLLINTTILIYVVRRLRQMAADSYSSLIDSELVQWEISLRQSLFTLGSYLVSLILLWLSYDGILPYIDPVVLIVFVVLTVFTLLREMIAAFKEIIGMRTISNKLQREIDSKVQSICETYNIKDHYLRVNKVGSTIVVEVDFLVDKEFKCVSVYQQDEIREEFEKSLSDLEYDLWLSIAFTTQYKWLA